MAVTVSGLTTATAAEVSLTTRLVGNFGPTPATKGIELQVLLSGVPASSIPASKIAGIDTSAITSVTSGRILGRISAGTGNAEARPLSDYIDQMVGASASFTGGFIYRTSLSWAGFPAGSAGQVIRSAGVTATAVWASLSASNIDNFNEAVDDRVAVLVTAGANISVSYNDTTNLLEIKGAGAGTTFAELSLTANQYPAANSAGVSLEARLDKRGVGVVVPVSGNGTYTLFPWPDIPAKAVSVFICVDVGSIGAVITKNGSAINGFGTTIAPITSAFTSVSSAETFLNSNKLQLVISSVSGSVSEAQVIFNTVRTS